MSNRRALLSRAGMSRVGGFAWSALKVQRRTRQVVQTRRLFLESLETRALLTTYTYPFGATPDDTGEYMLGEVAVNVVLMESDAAIAPHDNGTIVQKVSGSSSVTINYTPEDWTPNLIAAAKTKVADGLQWWEDTLHTMFPNALSNVLDFKINWQYADNPVHTGYEPIARTSNDLIGDSTTTGPGKGWVYDFLKSVGFDTTGNYTADMRAYNDFTRQQANTDWAFTIFVVNDEHDLQEADGAGEFSHYGSLVKAFSIPGGEFVVTPAGRPTSTYAHEVGHQFWGLDEYFGGSSYTTSRGYYNTQNYNAEDNPALASANEVQSIAPYQGTVSGGSFNLTINLASGASFTTGAIPYNASATTIRNAINTAAAGQVSGWSSEITVTGGPLTAAPITLTFGGSLVSMRNHPLAVLNGAGLTGGGTPGAVTEVKAGRVNQQQNSIMSTDHVFTPPSNTPSTFALSNSFNNHDLDPYTMATIGWQDTDQDGIFDVLDVPFTLTGSGQYDSATQLYSFRGSTKVNTLPNRNTSGTQNDITINQINIIEAQIDNGPWLKVAEYPARTYATNVSIDLHVNPGSHTVRFRSADTRTSVKSNVFQGDTDVPTAEALPGAGGVVFVDQNANGQWDNGESAKSGVSLVVKDANDAPLALTHIVEPDAFAQDWILNNVEPGATLSVTGDDGTTGDVVARTTALAASAGKVFTATDFLGASQPVWTDTQRLKVVFTTPVSTVSLKAYGTSSTTPTYARMDAYGANNQVIARYSTSALGNGELETMTVSRDQGDIKYVIAYGRLLSEVVLDSLQWGPMTTATTNNLGTFAFQYLPDGVYHVHVTAPSGYHLTSPANGQRVITVAGGVTNDNVDFGVAADVPPSFPFHNYGPKPSDRFNVNKNQDSEVTALDALIIINFINSRPADGDGTIPLTSNPDVIGYIDVIADGVCTAGDVLAVINYINSRPAGEGESGSTSGGTTGFQFGGGGLSPEGEGTVVVPQNAAEYFAQRPLHLMSVPGGNEPCMCSACVGAHAEAVAQVVQQAASGPVAGSGDLELAAAEPDRSESRVLERQLTGSRWLTEVKWNLTARASIAGNARKLGWALAEDTAEMESTLDEIAADVSQAETVILTDFFKSDLA